jgi:hypothetical protein
MMMGSVETVVVVITDAAVTTVMRVVLLQRDGIDGSQRPTMEERRGRSTCS